MPQQQYIVRLSKESLSVSCTKHTDRIQIIFLPLHHFKVYRTTELVGTKFYLKSQ